MKWVHELSWVVVAKGIGNQKQLTIFAKIGCDQSQGYLFSRPIKAEAMTALLEAKTTLQSITTAA